MEVGINPERRMDIKVVEAEAEEEDVARIHQSEPVTTVAKQVILKTTVEHSRKNETSCFVDIVILMVMMKVHVLS